MSGSSVQPTAYTQLQTNGAPNGHSDGPTNGVADGLGTGPHLQNTSTEIEVKCGPLLNYKHTSSPHTASPLWHGTVLLVTSPGQKGPELQLRCVGAVQNSSNLQVNGLSDGSGGTQQSGGRTQERSFSAERLYEDPTKAFWRFSIDVPLQAFEANWEYSIPNLRRESGETGDAVGKRIFSVPSSGESMRILFHSCNGFSVGTDEEAWSGPALWNDVLRIHEKKPVHVMIGGGDQIYNDSIRVSGPLRTWTDISNPKKRRDFPFNEDMRAKCDDFYFRNYVRWYGTEPFATANGSIPQINIWDDHDIIDGFGSYTDYFMKCHVFRGIGGVAYKYYLLFQQHLAPPKSTFTSDAPQTMHGEGNTDPVQLRDTFVMNETKLDPSYLIGGRPGPYVEERSRSIFCTLGAHIAFLGIDARMERTRHQINYPETYDMVFDHAAKQIAASNGKIKHLILLLGVPIAYPRLQWLENILSSPIIGPIRFLNKRFGVAGGLFNQFDGGVDLLDDLDDHYTAHQHKKERKDLVWRLQALAKQQSIRITILGGDVHLAAVGRFYSSPKLNIPAENDFRFMTNIVSSAITNHPPPAAVANLLARRNKIHHLDHDTDETLLNIWDKDPGEKANAQIEKKTAAKNHCTMPSRNFALITESSEHRAVPGTSTNGTHGANGTNGTSNGLNGTTSIQQDISQTHSRPPVAHHQTYQRKGTTNPREPIHAGEDNCGLEHPAADGVTRTGLGGPYGLDVCFRVEIDHGDRQGHTEGYGFSIPGLELVEQSTSTAGKHVQQEEQKVAEVVQS